VFEQYSQCRWRENNLKQIAITSGFLSCRFLSSDSVSESGRE
jgi:hypothetical protein